MDLNKLCRCYVQVVYFLNSKYLTFDLFLTNETFLWIKLQIDLWFHSDLLFFKLLLRPRKSVYLCKLRYNLEWRAPRLVVNPGWAAFPRFVLIFSWAALFNSLYKPLKSNIREGATRYWFITKLVRFQTYRDGFLYVRGLVVVFLIDASITDDEPLWEPIEWSLVQSWLLFIFLFSWIVENLICSRYGAFTGRDKRVWFGLYKWFWWFETAWIVSLFVACIFIIVPFYYEVNYSISNIVTWWDWYNRIFFFKFIFVYTIILMVAYTTQLGLRWLNWKKLFFLLFIVILFLTYLMFTQFIYLFFGYLTDINWYSKARWIDYTGLSHATDRWGWGPAAREYFTFHHTTTVFWFKNDIPYAGALLFIHLLFFVFVFFLFLTWVVLLRRIYTTKEMTYTSLTYAISTLRQFFYYFLLFYVLTLMSFWNQFNRYPTEHYWFKYTTSWLNVFFEVVSHYPTFLVSICV